MNKRKYKINKEFFKKWSPEMAYVLGWVYSDGNLASNRKRIKISSCDLDILLRIRELFESNYPIFSSLPNDRTKIQHVLLIDCEQIYDQLLLIGLTPRKSKTITLPTIPDKYFPHFLRGLIDGDGSIFVENRSFKGNKRTFLRCVIISASRKFLDDLQFKIHILLKVKTKNTTKDRTAFVVKYSIKESLIILSSVYQDSENNRLERKFKIYKDFLEHDFIESYRSKGTLKFMEKFATIYS